MGRKNPGTLDNGKHGDNRIGLYAAHLTWKKSDTWGEDAYGESCKPYIPNGMDGNAWSLYAKGDLETALRIFRAAGYTALWDGRKTCHSTFYVSLANVEVALQAFEAEAYSKQNKERIRTILTNVVDYLQNEDRTLDVVPAYMNDLTREEMHEVWNLTDSKGCRDSDPQRCEAFVEKYKAA